jgi:hypothetical protein
MRIAIIVEGDTERAFMPHLKEYLKRHLSGRMPKLHAHVYNGRVPTADKLRRRVKNLLEDSVKPADCVIALTDVYTGTRPPDFTDASDAKNKMTQWVGNEPRFYPHAAQHDFEAWLLPYWETIQQLAGHNRTAPTGDPEHVNHNKPPSYHIKEIFEIGNARESYIKPRDASRILRGKDLSVAISQCGELKAFVNTILISCGETPIP